MSDQETPRAHGASLPLCDLPDDTSEPRTEYRMRVGDLIAGLQGADGRPTPDPERRILVDLSAVIGDDRQHLFGFSARFDEIEDDEPIGRAVVLYVDEVTEHPDD